MAKEKKERPPRKKWSKIQKIMVFGVFGLLAIMIGFVSIIPDSNPNPKFTLIDGPIIRVDVRHEIKGFWDDENLLNQIRDKFYKDMRRVSEDQKYKKADVATLNYMGKSPNDNDLTFAMFKVNLKEWNAIDPAEYKNDYNDRSEGRRLGYLIKFNTFLHHQPKRVLEMRTQELVKKFSSS